ncbi:MAG: hypothetical protein OT477_14810 [Chloroflexi bacterium]|nr:hypothetical protein [Chloroflexota bacterium]
MTVTNGVITQADSVYAEFWTAPSGTLLATSYAIQPPSVTHRLSMGGSWRFSLPMADYDPSDMGVNRYVRVRAVFPDETITLFWGIIEKQDEEYDSGISMVALSGDDMLGEWMAAEIAEEEIYDTVTETAGAVYREYWQNTGAPDNSSAEEMPEAFDDDTGTAATLNLVDRGPGNFPTDLGDVALEHIYLYVGHPSPVDRVNFDLGPWPQTQLATLLVQQFLPSTEWTLVSPLANTTVVAGAPLAQSGYIEISKAEKEIQLTHAKKALYWLRFSHETPGVDLDEILIREVTVRTAGPATNDVEQVMDKCAPAGWTLHASSPTSTARKHQMSISGEKPIRALVRLAERSGELFALTNTREIRWMASPIASGITVKEAPESGDDDAFCYMKNLRRSIARREIVTRVYLEGAGDDPEAAVTLEHLRAGTYTLPTGYSVAGKWLIHTALETTGIEFAKRQKFKDIGALWGGTGGNPQAALELLKAGLAYLDIHKEHSQHFTGTLTGVRKPLTDLHCGMLLDVETAIRNANGDVVEAIEESLVLVEMEIQMDGRGELTYEVILAKQAEYLPGAEYLQAMQEIKAADRAKHFQPSSEHRLVRGASAGAGGSGGSGSGGDGGVDPVTFALHVAETTGAHEIPTQIDTKIATHAALTTTAHGIPSQIDAKIATHTALPNAHHNQSHVLATTSALGGDHTVSGLTSGQVLKATSATAARFVQLQHSEIGGVGANDHHNQSHVLATTSALGSDHTVSGLTSGQVLMATGASTAAFTAPSPSTLSSSTANNVSGASHTHAITAVTDANATPEALLKSTAAGKLTLRDLDIIADLLAGGNAIIVGNFSAGGNMSNGTLRVVGDGEDGQVGIRRTADEDISLDVAGVTRSDWFVGKWASQVRGAVLVCHYEDALNSTTGVSFTATGAVSYEDSPFGRALQSYDTLVNLIPNPSIEVNATGYGSDGVVTLSRSDEWSYRGGWALKWADYVSGAANLYFFNGVGGLDASSTYTWSVVVKRASGGDVGASQIVPLANWQTGFTSGTNVTYENLGGGAWRISQTFTTGASAGVWWATGLTVQVGHTAETWYADGWILVKQSFIPPIFDGDTPGCSWSGTAHASTSTRTALSLQYATQDTEDWTRKVIREDEGSILAWIKLPTASYAHPLGSDPAYFRTIVYLESGFGGPALGFKLDASGRPYAQFEGSVFTYYDTPLTANEQAMVVLTWKLSTNSHKVYLNGVEIAADDSDNIYEGFTIVDGDPFSAVSNQPLNGSVDMLVISNKELTAEEIELIHLANAPVFGTNIGESSGFSATTPKGRIWADNQGIHFADNDGNETGKQYIGEDGKSLINNDVEELRVANGTILLNADGVEILAVDGAVDEEDVPTYNKVKFVNADREIQSALFQLGNTLFLVSEPNDGGTTAGCFYRFISPLGAEIWFELIAQGTPQMRVRDGSSDVIFSADTTAFEAAKAGIKWTAGALTYKNQSAAVVTVGAAGADSAWVTPTLLNSWVNYAGSPTKSTAGYRLMPDGTVALKGVLKSGSSATAVMFTLPTGYRPSETRRFAGAANSAVGIIEVTTGGDVSFVVGGSTTQSSLDGVRFSL